MKHEGLSYPKEPERKKASSSEEVSFLFASHRQSALESFLAG